MSSTTHDLTSERSWTLSAVEIAHRRCTCIEASLMANHAMIIDLEVGGFSKASRVVFDRSYSHYHT
jgi:hypothetical protein